MTTAARTAPRPHDSSNISSLYECGLCRDVPVRMLFKKRDQAPCSEQRLNRSRQRRKRPLNAAARNGEAAFRQVDLDALAFSDAAGIAFDDRETVVHAVPEKLPSECRRHHSCDTKQFQ